MRLKIPEMRADKTIMDEFIADLPHGITMCEVGVYAGESCELFMKSGKVVRYIGVDDWRIGYDKEDTASNNSREMSDEAERQFKARAEQFAGRIDVLRMSSQAAAEHALKHGLSFGLIYLDAGHTYRDVIRDIYMWSMVLARTGGGILAGHDYRSRHLDVERAVHEIFDCWKPIRSYRDTSWRVDL